MLVTVESQWSVTTSLNPFYAKIFASVGRPILVVKKAIQEKVAEQAQDYITSDNETKSGAQGDKK